MRVLAIKTSSVCLPINDQIIVVTTKISQIGPNIIVKRIWGPTILGKMIWQMQKLSVVFVRRGTVLVKPTVHHILQKTIIAPPEEPMARMVVVWFVQMGMDLILMVILHVEKRNPMELM
ncbi:MAG: hypothetical protein CMD97_00005, partial [Gammaproteobacteria bacterium]|nr:hypothetical protein [Gammaproteobacteria bacterium]